MVIYRTHSVRRSNKQRTLLTIQKLERDTGEGRRIGAKGHVKAGKQINKSGKRHTEKTECNGGHAGFILLVLPSGQPVDLFRWFMSCFCFGELCLFLLTVPLQHIYHVCDSNCSCNQLSLLNWFDIFASHPLLIHHHAPWNTIPKSHCAINAKIQEIQQWSQRDRLITPIVLMYLAVRLGYCVTVDMLAAFCPHCFFWHRVRKIVYLSLAKQPSVSI